MHQIEGKNLAKYLVLLKINPSKTNEVTDALRRLPEKPSTGVDLYCTMNVFGTWDMGIWFNADNHDQAIAFVHNKIYSIPGVVETYTIPTTPIREYTQTWK